ncbi:MAG TPA: glutathione S-transferase family protein [Candidatus Binataceae bacterium]|nr:glutathione S-transferase family protein [Candidatus Binataceae bacterium]
MKLYGSAMSRSARALWALEELGLKYEHVPVEVPKAGGPEILKLNPNGRIPTLEDNGFVVWESMAINLYLAEKYGKAPFWPATPEGHALASQWSYWGMIDIEPSLITILRNRMFLPPDQRDQKAEQQAIDALNNGPLKILDAHLKRSSYLLGNDFTVADLNLASILSLATMVKLDFPGTPTANAWLQKCLSRPANQKVHGMK